MKKFLTIALATFSVASLSAQLRVISTGQVQAGSPSTSTDNTNGSNSVTINPDTTATLRIIGPDSYEAGGKIAFGNRRHVAIEETQLISQAISDRLPAIQLTGAGGFTYTDGSRSILSYSPYVYSVGSNVPSLRSSVPISAPQYITVSDSRSKTDIEPLEDIGLRLGEIVPVSYHLIDNENAGKASLFHSQS